MTLSFKYPITKADGTEFKSAKELLVQMQGESSGFYLMSAHGFWHGGVHISDSTAPYAVDSYPVRAIADGVVVAQRLNREYLISTWGQGDQAQSLKYSTSFCLIEHSYESPHKKSPSASAPAPAAARGATTRTPAPAPAASADQGPQNKLVFFSLYMHLLPYEGYAQKLTLQSGSVSAYVQLPTGGGTAPATTSLASPDPGQASNPVPVPDAGTIPASVTLAAGTQFSVLDEAQVMLDGKPTRLFYVRVEGTPPAGGTGTHYWITEGAQWTADNGKTPLICPTYWKTHKVTAATKKTINARQAPSGEHIGAPIHTIPAGTTVEIQSEKSLKLPGGRRPQPFVEATILSLGPGATGTLAAGSTVWLSGDRDFLARDPVIPEAFDQVVVLPTPGHPIKAGDPIGYLGLYETPSDGNSGKLSKHQLHLEVFTGDPAFADFFANKAGLTTEGKMFKVAPSGTRPSRRSADGSFSPASDQFSVATMVDTSGGAAVEDAQHVKWYSADGIGFNGVLSGWVSEKQLRDVSQFDWGKLGFQKVEETNDNADGYMDPDQLPDFFKQIYRIIDKNSDNDVSADELVTANKNPAVAYALSHAVAKHPSEWQGKSDAAKWKVLKEKDQLLKNDPTRLKHESERIDKLVWWDDAKSVQKLPPSPNVWHFHAIRFVENMRSLCIPLETSQEIAVSITNVFEGGSTQLNFSAVADNFDGMGMSFGIVQWNFGTGTLTPVLKDMLEADPEAFDHCFNGVNDYQSLRDAIKNNADPIGARWAINQQSINPGSWKSPFQKLGQIDKFKQIELQHAAKYHANVLECIDYLKKLRPEFFEGVELRSYCAFYDLGIQQNNLHAAEVEIRRRVDSDHPGSQLDIVKIAVEERAKKAKSAYVADCLSRRLGILQKSTYAARANGHSSSRANANFHLLDGIEDTYVCGL